MSPGAQIAVAMAIALSPFVSIFAFMFGLIQKDDPKLAVALALFWPLFALKWFLKAIVVGSFRAWRMI